jgi:hypothetical protein
VRRSIESKRPIEALQSSTTVQLLSLGSNAISHRAFVAAATDVRLLSDGAKEMPNYRYTRTADGSDVFERLFVRHTEICPHGEPNNIKGKKNHYTIHNIHTLQ